jgi:copper(I)-binding protein
MRQLALALLATLSLCGAAQAHSVKKDAIEIIHPHINEPFAGARSAAAYMAISNEGETTIRLIGIDTAAAKVTSLHTTEHGSDGVARMQPIAGIDIPAGETVVLEPGGMHVMLMGLTAPLKEGDMVPATFLFEQMGPVEVEFMVDPTDGVDHSKMGH